MTQHIIEENKKCRNWGGKTVSMNYPDSYRDSKEVQNGQLNLSATKSKLYLSNNAIYKFQFNEDATKPMKKMAKKLIQSNRLTKRKHLAKQ